MTDDVCLQLYKDVSVLSLCTQLQNSKCYVSAINTLEKDNNFIWVENSPLLHTLLVPNPNGMTCAGFAVTVLDKRPKGRIMKILTNQSYYDVEQFVQKNTSMVSAWSAPTNLRSRKKIYCLY